MLEIIEKYLDLVLLIYFLRVVNWLVSYMFFKLVICQIIRYIGCILKRNFFKKIGY